MDDVNPDTLERACEGSIDAFEEVYKATSSFVYNVALRITRNSVDAEEVTQDVFMKIYHSLKDFHYRCTFKTWAYRITVNTAINHYRKSVRHQKNRQDFDSAIKTLPGGSSTAEVAIQSDNEARLNTLLGCLSLEHKTCIILREIEGLSYQEIASIVKVPINTVRSRLKRARLALLEIAGKGLV